MFASREDAGKKLGLYLAEKGIRADVVLGLPRGGVVVAAEVSRLLQAPLEVLVVRKIGHPRQREFAVGALAQGGVLIFDQDTVTENPSLQSDLLPIIAEEKERLRAYETLFQSHEALSVQNIHALVIDDGLATGATAEAAVVAVRRQNPARVTVATPVASVNAVHRLKKVADDVIALLVDPDFEAVGRYYDIFSQTTDEQVLELLRTEHRV